MGEIGRTRLDGAKLLVCKPLDATSMACRDPSVLPVSIVPRAIPTITKQIVFQCAGNPMIAACPTMETTFPLPEGYFPPLQYSPSELVQWKRLVISIVERTLHEEQPVFASSYERIDTDKWKMIKTKDQMRVYQPRHSAVKAAMASSSPCVLAVGTINGTLEDVIFGIHNTTTRDIRATRAFLNDKSLDSAVLHVFENGIEDDPYRSLALKWRAVETPAGSLVRNRDGCVLEYVGISCDHIGRRYAFQVSENVDNKICPPFTAQGVIRADIHIRAIYRELDANRVGVYFYAGYNMSGQIPKFLASWTAASVAFSVGKSVECAEAKKLTALALSDLNVTLRQKRRRPLRRLSNIIPTCAICCTAPTYLSSLSSRSALSACQICTTEICGKCSSQKCLLSETGPIRVSCCKQCIVAAKNFIMDPRHPLPLVSLQAWTSRGEIVADRVTRRMEQAVVPYELRDTISTESEWIDSPTASMSMLSGSQDIVPIISSSGRLTGSSIHEDRELNSPTDMWMQMRMVRAAAEETYRITKDMDRLIDIHHLRKSSECRVSRTSTS